MADGLVPAAIVRSGDIINLTIPSGSGTLLYDVRPLSESVRSQLPSSRMPAIVSSQAALLAPCARESREGIKQALVRTGGLSRVSQRLQIASAPHAPPPPGGLCPAEKPILSAPLHARRFPPSYAQEMVGGDPELEELFKWDEAGPAVSTRGALGGGEGTSWNVGPIHVCSAKPGDVLQARVRVSECPSAPHHARDPARASYLRPPSAGGFPAPLGYGSPIIETCHCGNPLMLRVQKRRRQSKVLRPPSTACGYSP